MIKIKILNYTYYNLNYCFHHLQKYDQICGTCKSDVLKTPSFHNYTNFDKRK